MIELVERNLDAIAEICREFGVSRLELFGSAATGEFDPDRSDIDFIVHYPEGYEFGPWLTRHFALRERLEALLGRKVELVMASGIRKPWFLRSINLSRQELYAA